MSSTESFFVLDSENSVVGDKHKIERTSNGSFGSAARKRLGDISNLPQRPKPLTQDEKSQFISTTNKEYIDQLQKENMALMKLLVDRNKIIELSGIELRKMRVNLQKGQQQNLQLAQANSQLLAELTSGKDRLKALQHELGCKNGLLIAKKLELEEKANTRTCQKIESEVGTSKCKMDSSQADGGNRKQKSKSLGPSAIKQVQTKEKAENKRFCLRRSARFKPEEAAPTGDLFEIDSAEFPVRSQHDDQMQDDGSTSLCSSVEKEDEEGNTARDDAQELQRLSIGRPSQEKANTTTCEKIESEVGTSKCEKESSQADGGNNRPCNDNRKQKSKCLGPSAIKQVQANVKAENKRLCLRRSARFKPEEAALAGDLLEVDNAKFPVRSQHDDQMQDDGSTSTCSSVKKEDKEGNTARGDDAQELQRLSIGRPSRLAAKKVQSYKEVPLNVKMRRTD